MLLIAHTNKTNCEFCFGGVYDSGTGFIDLASLRNIRCPQDLKFNWKDIGENFVAGQFPTGSLSKEDQTSALFQIGLAIIYVE